MNKQSTPICTTLLAYLRPNNKTISNVPDNGSCFLHCIKKTAFHDHGLVVKVKGHTANNGLLHI